MKDEEHVSKLSPVPMRDSRRSQGVREAKAAGTQAPTWEELRTGTEGQQDQQAPRARVQQCRAGQSIALFHELHAPAVLTCAVTTLSATWRRLHSKSKRRSSCHCGQLRALRPGM